MKVGDLFVEIGIDDNEFKKGLSGLEQETQKKGNTISGIIKNAFSFAGGMAIFQTIKSGFENSVKAGIDFNATMEQNKIAFDTMLGSAEKSDAMLKQLSDFAAKTPFEFPELTDAAKKMLAMGFSAEEVMPTLKSVGDAAAGLGLSGSEGVNRLIIALGQMKAKGKVSAEEMMQLTEAGVPAWDMLAESMGMSTAEVMKLSSQGLIPADQAISALVEGMENRFPNMMDKQSKSFNGMMSTIKDNLNVTFGQVMQPAFEWLTNNILPKAIDLIEKFGEGFASGGLKGALEAIFPESVKPVIEGIFNTISTGLGWIKDNGEIIKTILAGIVAGFMAFEAVSFIQSIPGMLGGVKKAIMGVNAAMAANPIGIVIALVAALVGAFIYLWNTNEGFREAILNIWGSIKEFFTTTFEAIKETITTVWTAIKDFFTGIWESISTAITNAWNSITGFLSSVWGNISSTAQTIWQGIVNFITNLWNGFVTIITGIWNGILTVATTIWNAIVLVFTTVFNSIKTVITTVWETIKTFLTDLWDKIKETATTVWNTIKEFFTTTISTIKDKIVEIWDSIKNFLSDTWDKIKETATTVWTNIKNSIASLFADAKEKVIEIATNIWNKIKETWDGILENIKGMASKIQDAVVEPFNTAKEKVLNIAKDAFNWGKNLVQNIIDGIKSMISKVADVASNVASTISNFLGFHSPAKEGPGSDADKWMPNLMGMLNQGIQENIPRLQANLNAALNVPQIMQPTMPNINMPSTGASIGNQTIIIELDGRVIAQSTVEHMPRVLKLKGAIG